MIFMIITIPIIFSILFVDSKVFERFSFVFYGVGIATSFRIIRLWSF